VLRIAATTSGRLKPASTITTPSGVSIQAELLPAAIQCTPGATSTGLKSAAKWSDSPMPLNVAGSGSLLKCAG